MADFVDREAPEAPEEEPPAPAGDEEPQLPDDEEGLPASEAEASSGSDDGSSDGSDDSSAEGEEEEDEFEKDGFIVDEDDEEGGAGGGGGDDDEEGGAGGSDVEGAAEAKKRRKKRRRRELVLDEEDYELLEDNTGIRRQRPQATHRRIKKARDAEGGAAGAAGGAAADAARALQEELFGGESLEDAEGLEDEDEEDGGGAGAGAGAAGRPPSAAGGRPPSAAARRDEPPPPEPAEDFFEDDEDDWLVHEDEEEEGNAAAARARRRARRAELEGIAGIDADALAEAEEIFGNADELMDMFEHGRRVRRMEDEGTLVHDSEVEGEEGEDEEEADARRKAASKERAAAAAARRAREHLDPEALARHYLLPRDEQIRERDVPEREQLHRGPEPEAFDLGACAKWVWERLIGPRRYGSAAESFLKDGVREVEGSPPAWYGAPTWDPRDLKYEPEDLESHRGLFIGRDKSREAKREWRANEAAQAELRAALQAVLYRHYVQHEEVPLIAQYRKEVCGELLCLRSSDWPEVVEAKDGEGGFPKGTMRPQQRRARRYDILYTALALAQRWRALQVRREARRRAYAAALDATVHDGERAAITACLERLGEVDSMEELDDVEAKFRLATHQHSPEEGLAGLALANGGGTRRPQKATGYALCARAGLGGWVEGLGLSAAQFAENLALGGYLHHKPPESLESPLALAAHFVAPAGGFSTPEAVVKGGVHMAAAQLAAEPALRTAVRAFYERWAAVWTAPTPAGVSTLDPFHPLGPVKRLQAKPLQDFDGTDTFLRLQQAEREGLITVRFGIPRRSEAQDSEQRRKEEGEPDEAPAQTLLDELAAAFCSGSLTGLAAEWDEVRRRVLAEAVRELLLPQMEREARARLGAAARAAVGDACADALWRHASRPPLEVRLVDEEDRVERDRRVMALCYGPGDPPTTAVMLDPAGNLVDFLHLPQFSGPIPKRKAVLGQVYSLYDDPKKGKDAARLRAFIQDHLPHAIVVGASSPEARTLELDLGAVLENILIDNPRFIVELGTGRVQLLMADEAVAAAWETSAGAREELAASAAIVRRAVGLGRQLLDPLAMLSALCGPGREVLALPLHPLQAALSEEERLAAVERTLVTAASHAGVDLNAAAASTWLHASVQWVPGLGPRKAAALLRAVARAGGFVESRMQVWRELGVIGACVFRNAAPYLRIRASSKGAQNLDLDALDDSRVHPSDYKFALQMARSAIAGGEDEANGTVALDNALAQPGEVAKLEVAFYDAHLRGTGQLGYACDGPEEDGEEGEGAGEGEGGGGAGRPSPPASRLPTLIDIQFELVQPYGELRGELEPLKPEEAFFLCAGETRETLRPGRRVEARVRTVGDKDARCILPDVNGVEGVLEAVHVSASAARNNELVAVRDFVQPNATLAARIIALEPALWQVQLSTRSDVLNDDRRWEREYLERDDPYYVVPTEEEARRAAAAEHKRRSGAGKFTARPIQHPLFRNVSLLDAAAALEGEATLGAAIIRPSHRGPARLCLSLRLPESIWHLDLEERGKPPTSVKLGSPLTLELYPGAPADLRFSFEDLDEVAARFVEPLQERLAALAAHRKYRAQGWEGARGALADEKRGKPPGQAAYAVGPDATRAGLFWLGYVLNATPAREAFMVTPEGFYFRKKLYPSVDRMLREWQKKPRPEPQAAAAPPRPDQRGAPPPPPQQQQFPPAMATGGGWGQQQPPLPPGGPPVYGYQGGPPLPPDGGPPPLPPGGPPLPPGPGPQPGYGGGYGGPPPPPGYGGPPMHPGGGYGGPPLPPGGGYGGPPPPPGYGGPPPPPGYGGQPMPTPGGYGGGAPPPPPPPPSTGHSRWGPDLPQRR